MVLGFNHQAALTSNVRRIFCTSLRYCEGGDVFLVSWLDTAFSGLPRDKEAI
jgi:hypothetical protein